MTGLTEYILGVSGEVLLAVWLALLAAAVFWRPTPIPGRPGWLAARCQAGAPTWPARVARGGAVLPAAVARGAAVLTLATSAWALALVTYSVVHHTGLARDDPRV